MQRAARSSLNGAGVVRGARAREERRPEAVLRQRPREAAGRVRSVDERHAARADRRLRRRRPRGPHAQGGDSRRIVGADPDARSARHRRPASTRVQKAGSLLGSAGDRRARRHHLHGLAGREPAALLPPRVVRQVHAVPRRHRLAATRSCSASSAAKGRCAISICSSSISGNIAGKTLCAFGDAAVTPVLTTLKHFRHEYEAHIREGRCTLPAPWRAAARPWRSALMLPSFDQTRCDRSRTARADALRLRRAAALGGGRWCGSSARSRRCCSSGSGRTWSARKGCCSRSPTSSS